MKNRISYICLYVFMCSQVLNAQEYYPLPADLRCETNVTEPLTLRKGYFRATFGFDFCPSDCYFDESGGKTRSLKSITGNMHLSGISSYLYYYKLKLQYGVTDNFSLGIQLPYSYGEDMELTRFEIVPTGKITNYKINSYSKGFDDISFGIGYQILSRKDLFSAISVNLLFPTGTQKADTIKKDNYTEVRQPVSSGSCEVGMEYIVKKIYYPFYFSLSPSFQYTSENVVKKAYTDLSINGACGFLVNDWFSVNSSLMYLYTPEVTYKLNDFVNKNIYFVQAGISIIQQAKRFRIYEKMVIPLLGKRFASTNMNIMFAVDYTL